MTERVFLVGVVVAVAFLAMALWERRPTSRVGAGPGVTLVTGPDCRMCTQAVEVLGRHGVEPRLVDAAEASGLGVRSVPTVFVTGSDGALLLRRSGRTVITDAIRIAELARGDRIT